MTTQEWNEIHLSKYFAVELLQVMVYTAHKIISNQSKKVLAFCRQIGYILNDTPVTPLSFQANAHFGRVFYFTGIFNQGGLYGKI